MKVQLINLKIENNVLNFLQVLNFTNLNGVIMNNTDFSECSFNPNTKTK